MPEKKRSENLNLTQVATIKYVQHVIATDYCDPITMRSLLFSPILEGMIQMNYTEMVLKNFMGITYALKLLTRNDANDFLEANHYARNRPVSMLNIGVYEIVNGEYILIGVISYGKSVSDNVRKAIAHNLKENEYMELLRLCVLDVTGKNFESWFIAISFEVIKELYPEVCVLISFADPAENHEGIIYRATNWLYCGKSANATYYFNTETQKQVHPKTYQKIRDRQDHELMQKHTTFKKPGKHRYIFVLRKSKTYYKDMRTGEYFDASELEYFENLEHQINESIIERYHGHYKKHYRYLVDDLKRPVLPYPGK